MKYYLKRKVELDFQEAIKKTKEELKKEGFGVLTEIDVKNTLKVKLDEDVNDYVILGACNPKLAHKTLEFEKEIGLLLPCNVIVYRNDSQETIVAAIDPIAVFKIINIDSVEEVAREVKNRLEKVLKNI